jgi:hypothetical protein
VNAQGNFGSSQGNAFEVFYDYQIETTPTTDEAAVNNAIIPQVEVAISSVILPLLFPDDCDSPFGRQLQENNVVGYNTRPNDLVLSNGKKMFGAKCCLFVHMSKPHPVSMFLFDHSCMSTGAGQPGRQLFYCVWCLYNHK